MSAGKYLINNFWCIKGQTLIVDEGREVPGTPSFIASMRWNQRGLWVCLYSPANRCRLSPELRVWDWSLHSSYLEDLLKFRLLGPTPTASYSVGLGWDPWICICQVPWWLDAAGPGPLLEDQLPRGLSFMHPNLSPRLGFAFTAQMGDESERKSLGRLSWGLGKERQGVSTRWPWAHLSPAILEVHDFRDEMDCRGQNPFIVKGKAMNPVGGSHLTWQPGQSHGDLNLLYLPR